MTRWLARRAGVDPDEIGWRVVEGPRFENHVGQLKLDGRTAMLKVEQAVTPDGGDRAPYLELLYEHRLSDGKVGT
jgi:hypothetical protein